MSAATQDWRSVFQYATDDLAATGDGYWLFAPMVGTELELFQASVMVVGDSVQSFATTVVTPDAVRRHEVQTPRGQAPDPGEQVVRHPERFCLEAGSHFTLSSDDPERSYRVQTTDAVNGVRADLQIRPATPLFWDVVGSDYRTTLDSVAEGTITIDGTAHAVSTPCAFEHSSWTVPSPGTPRPAGAMPPFWHYEYIQWTGGDAPFGSFLWHSLGNDGEKVQASEFHTSSPARDLSMYDTYDIVYKDIDDHDGRPLPGAWEVTATKGDENFAYRANVRRVMSSPANGAPGLSDFVLDCEGVHRGPDGETQLRGRGRTEYIVISHNPAGANSSG